MKRHRVCLFLAGLILAAGAQAQGGTSIGSFTTGWGFQSGVVISLQNHNYNGGNPIASGSGSIGLDPHATVNGVPTPFLYCVDIVLDIGVPTEYPGHAQISDEGTVYNVADYFGAAAGRIAWLIDNVAANMNPNAPDLAAQQMGLQGAIWKQIYGNDFALLGPSDVQAYYQADLDALVGHSAPVSDVLFISPFTGFDSDGNPVGWVQAQVTINPNAHNDAAVPEPTSLLLWGLGAAGLVWGGAFRRKTAAS